MLSHPISKRLNQINPIYVRAKTKLTPYFNNQNLKTDIVPFFFFFNYGIKSKLVKFKWPKSNLSQITKTIFFFFFWSETKILRKYRKTTKCHDTIITCAAETGVHEFIILTPPIGFMGHEGNNMFTVHSTPTRP